MDPQTIARFQEGDLVAFNKVYEATCAFIYNVIVTMVPVSEAEDLVHDIFIKVYEKRGIFNGKVKFTTWVYRIAMNHVFNYLKREKMKQRKWMQMFWETETVIVAEADINEESVWVRKVLDKIKPEFRLCLVLREVEGLSYEEIADMLKVPLGTVRSRINRAKNEFRQLAGKEIGYDQIKVAAVG